MADQEKASEIKSETENNNSQPSDKTENNNVELADTNENNNVRSTFEKRLDHPLRDNPSSTKTELFVVRSSDPMHSAPTLPSKRGNSVSTEAVKTPTEDGQRTPQQRESEYFREGPEYSEQDQYREELYRDPSRDLEYADREYDDPYRRYDDQYYPDPNYYSDQSRSRSRDLAPLREHTEPDMYGSRSQDSRYSGHGSATPFSGRGTPRSGTSELGQGVVSDLSARDQGSGVPLDYTSSAPYNITTTITTAVRPSQVSANSRRSTIDDDMSSQGFQSPDPSQLRGGAQLFSKMSSVRESSGSFGVSDVDPSCSGASAATKESVRPKSPSASPSKTGPETSASPSKTGPETKQGARSKKSAAVPLSPSDSHPLSYQDDDYDKLGHVSAFQYTYKKDSPQEGSLKREVQRKANRSVKPLNPGKLYMGDLNEDVSDAGRYSFFTLVAVALYRLYDNAPWDSKFNELIIKALGARFKQQKSVIEAAMTITRGDGMDDTRPFVQMLRQEDVVKQHGEEVLLFDLVGVILRQGVYDARSRTLVKYLSGLLLVEWERVEQYEMHLIETFMEEEHKMTEEEKKEKHDKDRSQKLKKYALIGVATVGGGALLGLTGGLAAPLIAAGAGAVIGGAGAAALGSVAGVYIIGSLFGVAGAGLAGYKMNKRVGDLEEFEFESLTEGRQLHVTVAISGWLTEENPDFQTAWRTLANSEEQYVLRYESKYLTQVGSAMNYIVDMAMKSAATEALKYTVLSGIMAAVAWPAALVTASSIIDNPWSVVMSRSALAGKQLANVLLARHQGKRPVTLIGFSLGARVIYYCLQELATRKNCEGIVEEVIMLGTPVTRNSAEWSKMSRVVSGRIINGYCRGDWLLKFLYRTASVQYAIAGLGAIDWQDRRMHNIDLTDVVTGHMDYQRKIDEIFDIIGVKTKPYVESSHKSLCDFKTGSISSMRSAASKKSVPSSTTTATGDKVVTGQSVRAPDKAVDALDLSREGTERVIHVDTIEK